MDHKLCLLESLVEREKKGEIKFDYNSPLIKELQKAKKKIFDDCKKEEKYQHKLINDGLIYLLEAKIERKRYKMELKDLESGNVLEFSDGTQGLLTETNMLIDLEDGTYYSRNNCLTDDLKVKGLPNIYVTKVYDNVKTMRVIYERSERLSLTRDEEIILKNCYINGEHPDYIKRLGITEFSNIVIGTKNDRYVESLDMFENLFENVEIGKEYDISFLYEDEDEDDE